MIAAVLGTLATVAASLLTYLGLRAQVRAGREGNQVNLAQQQQQSAFDAWRELLDPLRNEVRVVREELDVERKARQSLAGEVQNLTNEVQRWRTVARTLARWGITMRDQLRALGHETKTDPDELIALQILSDDTRKED